MLSAPSKILQTVHRTVEGVIGAAPLRRMCGTVDLCRRIRLRGCNRDRRRACRWVFTLQVHAFGIPLLKCLNIVNGCIADVPQTVHVIDRHFLNAVIAWYLSGTVCLFGQELENALKTLERFPKATSFTRRSSRNMVRHSGTTPFANHCSSVHCVHSQSSMQALIKSGRRLTLHRMQWSKQTYETPDHS